MIDQPRSLLEFQRDFPDEAACVRYLASRRWPDGFVCPNCGATRAHELVERRVWQCSACRQQTSLTAGTVLHGTRLPLMTWFWAMYLASTLTAGISAEQLRKQLGLSRYETAWMLLQKIRLAMVNPERERLCGEVEVDKAWVGGTQGVAGAHAIPEPNAVLVAIAVEHHEHGVGRVRMEVIPDASGAALTEFVIRNVVRDSTIHSDTWPGYGLLLAAGYRHQPRLSRRRSAEEVKSAELVTIVPMVLRVAANLRTWLNGTHHGVGAQHLERYLEEFVFRFNRRFYAMPAFDTLLGLTSHIEPTAYPELRGPRLEGKNPRRRGRATGATRARPRTSGVRVEELLRPGSTTPAE